MSRRLKRIPITPEAIMTCLLRSDSPVLLISDLPEGAQVVRVGYDIYSDCFQVIVNHPSFSEVPEGCEIPVARLSYSTEPRAIRIGRGREFL